MEKILEAEKRTLSSQKGAYRNELTNFTAEYYTDDKGKEKVSYQSIEAHFIWANLKNMIGNTIKRMGHHVFAHTAKELIYLNSPAELFGWMASRNVSVSWHRGMGMISKEEFLKYIGNAADHYELASTLPHYPNVKGFYYVNNIVPNVTGKLDELVDFFSPDTQKDRAFIKAAFATVFWGKAFGNRPGFLIVARDDDEKQGRGSGKTTITDCLSRLCGGHVDLSKRADADSIRKTLMSAADIRIARFDNIKEGAFSSETVESIMTAPLLSAHIMYRGHGTKPNIFNFFLTFNDAELSSDLSQRFVTIRIKRPIYDAEWLPRLNDFIDNFKENIIADIGALLLKPTSVVKTITRYPEWERSVLGKCLGDLQITTLHTAMHLDREAVDEMTNLRDEFSDFCRERIAYHAKCDPEKSTYMIRRSLVVNWLIEFKGKKMSKKSAHKLLAQALPQGFATRSKEAQGIDYMVWSGAWHRGIFDFVARSARRLTFKGDIAIFEETLFKTEALSGRIGAGGIMYPPTEAHPTDNPPDEPFDNLEF